MQTGRAHKQAKLGTDAVYPFRVVVFLKMNTMPHPFARTSIDKTEPSEGAGCDDAALLQESDQRFGGLLGVSALQGGCSDHVLKGDQRAHSFGTKGDLEQGPNIQKREDAIDNQ